MAGIQAPGLFGLLSRHRELTLAMTKREISDRYAGTAAGLLWAIGHPLLQMLVYIFLFAFVFKARVGGTRELPLDYVSYLLAGLLPWMAFQETMAKSSSVLVANANLVKQVVFPIEILPVKGVLAAMFTQLITTSILVIYALVKAGQIHASFALIPVLFALELVAMAGVAYLLAAVGAFFRDVKDLVQISSMVGMYLVPIAYVPEWVPKAFEPVLYLNPFSYMIWCFQDALFYGSFVHPYAWLAFGLGAPLSLFVGYRVFRRLRPHFGNVL